MTRTLLAGGALAAVLSGLSGCLYTDVRAPLSYGSATPGDVGGSVGAEVTGSACNTAILWLFAFGDGGYEGAVRDAKRTSGAPFLVDVKADTAYTNVLLGLYQRQCTRVTARLPGGPATAAASPAPAEGKAP
jgi:hypothetical protein